jgi:hypothetical protein
MASYKEGNTAGVIRSGGRHGRARAGAAGTVLHGSSTQSWTCRSFSSPQSSDNVHDPVDVDLLLVTALAGEVLPCDSGGLRPRAAQDMSPVAAAWIRSSRGIQSYLMASLKVALPHGTTCSTECRSFILQQEAKSSLTLSRRSGSRGRPCRA